MTVVDRETREVRLRVRLRMDTDSGSDVALSRPSATRTRIASSRAVSRNRAPSSPSVTTIMLGDDDDVFDSVTWESPPVPITYEGPSATASGPGFRQSTSESEDGRSPHDPKWEGYLITTVKDPVKELAETKDAYVSYLVSAKVGHY